jgi:hypothetical protein
MPVTGMALTAGWNTITTGIAITTAIFITAASSARRENFRPVVNRNPT